MSKAKPSAAIAQISHSVPVSGRGAGDGVGPCSGHPPRETADPTSDRTSLGRTRAENGAKRSSSALPQTFLRAALPRIDLEALDGEQEESVRAGLGIPIGGADPGAGDHAGGADPDARGRSRARDARAGNQARAANRATGGGSGGTDRTTGRGPGGEDRSTGNGPGGTDRTTGRGPGGKDRSTGNGPGGTDRSTGRGPGGTDRSTGNGPGGPRIDQQGVNPRRTVPSP